MNKGKQNFNDLNLKKLKKLGYEILIRKTLMRKLTLPL